MAMVQLEVGSGEMAMGIKVDQFAAALKMMGYIKEGGEAQAVILWKLVIQDVNCIHMTKRTLKLIVYSFEQIWDQQFLLSGSESDPTDQQPSTGQTDNS